MKILKLKNEVFEYEVEWLISDDKKEVSDYLTEKVGHSNSLDISEGYTMIKDSVGYLYLTNTSDYVLLHECIHIVQHILYDKGIDTGFSNTEVLAYNTDWLYRKLLLAYYKDKKDDRYKKYL